MSDIPGFAAMNPFQGKTASFASRLNSILSNTSKARKIDAIVRDFKSEILAYVKGHAEEMDTNIVNFPIKDGHVMRPHGSNMGAICNVADLDDVSKKFKDEGMDLTWQDPTYGTNGFLSFRW